MRRFDTDLVHVLATFGSAAPTYTLFSVNIQRLLDPGVRLGRLDIIAEKSKLCVIKIYYI
jgi:hypothetical protein